MQELQIKMFALQTIDHTRDKRKRPLSLITSYQSQLEKDKKTKKLNEKKDKRKGLPSKDTYPLSPPIRASWKIWPARFQVEIPRQESNPCKIDQNTYTIIHNRINVQEKLHKQCQLCRIDQSMPNNSCSNC